MPPKCPFYGMQQGVHGDLVYLKASQGDQCGFIPKTGMPCEVERRGLDPSWGNCYLYNDPVNRLDAMGRLDRAIIFPTEDLPDFSFRKWLEFCLGSKTLD